MDRKEKLSLYKDRFYGRQDVFGRYWSTVTDDGGKRSGYAPRCSNFWKSMCHLKNKTGVGCDSCEHKQYVPVSEETLRHHITGEDQPQIQYVLQTDGTVKFGAIDYDMKPGKEDKGYSWEDVKKSLDQLEKWGIPFGVARSTSNGFHVYIFMEDFYAANKFRAIIWELYDRVGFMEYQRMNIKSIPEIFPKQSYNSPSGLGNGIKTPMIVGSFAKERNGFVDNQNVWIGKDLSEDEMIAAQWNHLAAIPKATTAQLDALIESEHILVHEDGPGAKVGGNYSPHSGPGRSGKWQPPVSGSIEKVLEGCAAFRKIRDKAAAGTVVGHDEGFALYHMAMRTYDGLDYFSKNVPGWGKTDADMKQLEHSLKKDYAPWTCRTMQDKGMCVAGTQCFKKKPPVETVEGQTVVRSDIPMDKWPEPSPVRYAFGAGDDFLKKLMAEGLVAKEIKDKEEKVKVLKGIAYRAQVFDDEQQKELRGYLKEQKVGRISEIGKVFKEAAEESATELKKNLGDMDNSTRVDENLYQKKTPFGYFVIKAIRSNRKVISICDADITIDAIKTYIDEDREVEVNFHGVVKAVGVEKKFELSTARWWDDKEFLSYFGALLGSDFNVMKANVPAIRQASMAFSKENGVDAENWFLTQGWYGVGKSYIMPSVIVDKDGVRPNTEKKIDLSRKSHAKALDFAIIAEEEFRETLFHIKAELLSAWPRKWTTVALGHTLLPVILGPLGSAFSQKPTLFFEGLTGAGKTALTKIMQCFWGQFDKILTLQSSSKGVIDVGYDFKDALLVVDDYKGLSNEQTMAVKQAIQYSYGDDTSIKMNRNQTQNKGKGVRAVLMMTGEQFLTSEASMVARCILIETDKQDTIKTQDLYMKCVEMKSKYSGVTARYINWFLNQDSEEVRGMYNDLFNDFHRKSSFLQNSSRLSYNLALNHLSYKLFISFMQHHDVISHVEAKDLVLEHAQYAEELLWSMSGRCSEEQNGWVFLRILRQLLDSGEVAIKGIRKFEHSNKKVIGFAGKDRTHVNLYPELTWQAAKSVRDIPLPGDVRSIGRQLKDQGILLGSDGERFQKQVRLPDGSRQRVWVCDIKKLGYEESDCEPSEFEESAPGQQRLDGIL